MDTPNRFTIVPKSEPDIVDAIRAAVKKKRATKRSHPDLKAIEGLLRRIDGAVDRLFAIHTLFELALADQANPRIDQAAAARDFLHREAFELRGARREIGYLLEKERGA